MKRSPPQPLVLSQPAGARVYEPGSVPPGKIVALRSRTYVVLDRSGTLMRTDHSARRLTKAEKKAAKRTRHAAMNERSPS